VYTRGTMGRRQIVLLETQIGIFLVAGNISLRGCSGMGGVPNISLGLFNCSNVILDLLTMENIFSKEYTNSNQCNSDIHILSHD